MMNIIYKKELNLSLEILKKNNLKLKEEQDKVKKRNKVKEKNRNKKNNKKNFQTQKNKDKD